MSAVAIGGLANCDNYTPKDENNEAPHPLAIPNQAVQIRVRVGRYRNGEHAKVNDGQLRMVGDELQTTNAIKALFDKSDSTQFVSRETRQFTIDSGEKQKVVTGKLHIHARGDIGRNDFDIVAHVPIEQYLPGVLAGELYAHWHPDTFAAQAVAARSYAIVQHLNRIKTSNFDVTDGPSSQMFLGDVSLEVAHNATKETEGVILSWNSTVVPAYYSACCGGRAASALDAISNSSQHDILPLIGRNGKDVCADLETSKWRATRSSRVFRKRLNASANNLNLPELEALRSVRSIEPCEQNKHGRPTKLMIKDRRRHSIVVRARDFLSAANASVSSLPLPGDPVWSSTLSCSKAGSDLAFEGRGLGHGVGLCQYGAQELAGQNKSWEDILQWYYPNARIQSI